MKNTLLILSIVFFTAACANGEKEIELENRISKLETQLDECKNGPVKLLAKINLAFENKKFDRVNSIYSDFKNQYPESLEFKEAKSIHLKSLKIEEKEKIESEKIESEKREEKLKALAKLKVKPDDVTCINWYYNPYFTHFNNRNLMSIYMGEKKPDQPWLNLKMSYKGDDWIFFEHAYLSYDGETIEIPFDKYDDKETDNSNGVWEWIQVSVSSDIESFLRKFAHSKKAKMRLSGKYSETRILSDDERQGILDVLNGYDALKEK